MGNKPWVAITLIIAMALGGCFELTKKDDNTTSILGVLLLSQNNKGSTTTIEEELPQPISCSETEVGCRIFLTAGVWNGNLGGVSGADEKCNTDSNKPTGNFPYKALLVDEENRTITISDSNTANPTVSNVKDWPLKVNTTYFQRSGAEFGRTNADAIFVYNSKAMRVGSGLEGLEYPINFIHTGLSAANSGTVGLISNTNCSDWTSDSNSMQGRKGGLISTNPIETGLDGQYQYSCNLMMNLVCVEQ